MEEKSNSRKDGSSLEFNISITNKLRKAKDSTALGAHKKYYPKLPHPTVVNPYTPSTAFCAESNHDPVSLRIRPVISGQRSDDSEKNYPCTHLASSSFRPGSQSACLQCVGSAAESENQIMTEDDCHTKGKLGNCNETSDKCSFPKENKIMSNFAPGIIDDLPKEIDWESYRNFLFNVWEENSLSNSSLDSESSTLPSLSSISGEFPYALNILTMEKSPSSPSSNRLATGGVSHETPPESKPMESNAQYPRHSCCKIQIVNSEMDSELEKPPRPLPLANKLENSSSSQGNVSRCPAQLQRSEAQNQPLQKKTSLSQPYKEGQIRGTAFRRYSSPQHRLQRHGQPRQREKNALPEFFVVEAETSDKSSGRAFSHLCCDKDCTNKGHTPNHNWKVGANTNLSLNSATHDSEIFQLQQEMELSQKRIDTLSQKMEDQSSRLQLLIGATKRKDISKPLQNISPTQPDPRMTFPALPHGYKASHHGMYSPGVAAYGYGHPALSRRASCQYPCEIPGGSVPAGLSEDILMSQITGTVRREIECLRDRIVAHQMENIELNLFLKKEELKRKEAEEALKKEKDYVKKLQNSLQDLSTSSLVMDPLTYKQVADKYIASRKKAVRRTHTCNPSYLGSSDLVCDSNNLKVSRNPVHSTSCPSSPLGSTQDRRTSSTYTPSGEGRLEAGTRLRQEPASWEGIRGSSPLSPEDYKGLLHSLEGLQLSSSPS